MTAANFTQANVTNNGALNINGTGTAIAGAVEFANIAFATQNLSAVHEPASLSVLLLGVIGVALTRRRRRPAAGLAV